MTKQIAIIDPYVNEPANQCFNHLVELLNLPATYHMPASSGLDSLLQVAPKTRAYIVLGSASHVHQMLPWQQELATLLLQELRRNKPVLGCCFGHQLLCHAFGSKIDFHHPNEDKLSGLREIKIKRDFWNYSEGESFLLPVTHRQVVKELGPELQEVSSGFPNDVVIHRSLPFLGTQAHPEASRHFCGSDIGKLSQHEIAQGQAGGERFIHRFFHHFGLL
jgi:GMP synthase-like glutamine amidotransferase